MIQEKWLKIKVYLEVGVREWGLATLVLLIALACFGLGRLSALLEGKGGVQMVQAVAAGSLTPGGKFVASNTGEAYYFPWCGGVQNIPADKQVWFDSAADAERAGYRAAKNCKGL